MAFSSGHQIAHYKIHSLIGKGGMGEVYRAEDTKLDREVAIKVLPAALAADPERLARFEREAKVLASLNHPNIAQIYGVEEGALVMELVEGESPKGPMPFDEAWKIMSQVAEGLEYAHERRVVHRDLKPSNLKVTPDGQVKILDFGLAKALSGEPRGAASAGTDSPTLTMGATQAGVILGTAAYMAPEQIKGKVADRRADIWAFGVVLYELLTGERPFTGKDATEIMARAVTSEPVMESAPLRVRRLLAECLQKEPQDRLAWVGDAGRLLEGIAPGTAGIASPRSRLSALPWAAAAVFAVVAGYALWPKPIELKPLVRFDIDLGSDVSLPPPDFNGGNVILSPDGTRLVYTASIGGGPTKLCVRKLSDAKTTELAGTEGATAPFFSPDSQWIGFSTGGLPGNKINKVSVEGGAVVPIAAAMGGLAAWDQDGSIFVGQPQGVGRIPPGGGTVSQFAPGVPGEFADWAPQILPSGAVLFQHYTSPGNASSSVQAITLSSNKRKILARGGSSPRYLPDPTGSGYLIYNTSSTLFAVAFDPNKLETHGTPVPVLDDVLTDSQGGVGQFAFSPVRGGTLVYRKGSGGAAAAPATIQWLDTSGKRQPLTAKPGNYQVPRFSPDGKRLVVQQASDMWVYEWQRDAWTKLTFGAAPYIAPTWSPDGRFVVFGSISGGMFWTRSDGAGQPQRLTQNNGIQGPWSFTPDGKRLAFFEGVTTGANLQIWTVPIEETGGELKAGKPERFLQDNFVDNAPVFSPDGHWLAYISDESGRYEIYVRAFPPPASGQGGKWLISNAGARDPVWSRNGHELLYLSSDDQMMSVGYTVQGDSFVPEKPRVWLRKLGELEGGPQAWDLAPDGKRVAVVTRVNTAEAPKAEHEVVVLENFIDYLRGHVSAK